MSDPSRTRSSALAVVSNACAYAVTLALMAIAHTLAAPAAPSSPFPPPDPGIDVDVDFADAASLLAPAAAAPRSSAYWRSACAVVPVFAAAWIVASVAARTGALLFLPRDGAAILRRASPAAGGSVLPVGDAMACVGYALVVPTALVLMAPDFVASLACALGLASVDDWDFRQMAASPSAGDADGLDVEPDVPVLSLPVVLVIVHTVWCVALLGCAISAFSRKMVRAFPQGAMIGLVTLSKGMQGTALVLEQTSFCDPDTMLEITTYLVGYYEGQED
ncbi:hypothetical protein Pelo_9097 [Pelomyxa schiedti]|nr:hypothetical protein Pelo_9097 [Pelomyxa schiedti]